MRIDGENSEFFKENLNALLNKVFMLNKIKCMLISEKNSFNISGWMANQLKIAPYCLILKNFHQLLQLIREKNSLPGASSSSNS